MAFMERALTLARAQLGRVAPNPAVGCVIVRDGAVVGEGATGPGGRPHAEEIALESAGPDARGATVYVSLEPCAQRTSARPSCANLLIDAGVARVVIACAEPNPHSAHGASALRAAGVDIDFGVLEAEASYLNRGFFKLIRCGRPWLSVDADASRHDAEFQPAPGEALAAALDRYGAAGLTRVFVSPDNSLASELQEAGLVDEIAA